jgi:hypothetical protein
MIDETLLQTLPPVVRARGFRLYTQDGRRLVDLWQNNGAAILGHTGGSLKALKNAAERGLYAPFPHSQERRFHRALSTLLPGMEFRLYRGPLPPMPGAEDLPDPAVEEALPPPPPPAASLWRPFLAVPRDRILAPVLPLPWPEALRVLALPPREDLPPAPESQLISPVILAVATRGVYDLIAAGAKRPPYPRIEEALTEQQWRRRGIYLSKNAADDEAYAALFRRFLDQGFLLPPVRTQPLILPGELSPGEEAKLAGLLAAQPQ